MSFLLLIAVALIPRDAHAYLDPGTGSILLQALAGGVAGLLFLLKFYWKRIRGLFHRSPPGDSDVGGTGV